MDCGVWQGLEDVLLARKMANCSAKLFFGRPDIFHSYPRYVDLRPQVAKYRIQTRARHSKNRHLHFASVRSEREEKSRAMSSESSSLLTPEENALVQTVTGNRKQVRESRVPAHKRLCDYIFRVRHLTTEQGNCGGAAVSGTPRPP